MKSKKILIIFTLLLCSSVVLAQTRIDKEVFDRLVDYVNCKYTSAYFENIRQEPHYEKQVKIFDEKIKKKI